MRTFLLSHYRKAFMVLLAGAFLWLLANQRQAYPHWIHQELSGQTMGTTWHVQVALPKADDKLAATGTSIINLLAHLDKGLFSTYDSASELSRLNATPVGKALMVSREMQEVLLLSRTINRQSFGTFDVTVGPLVKLWGFGPDPSQGVVPADPAIKAALARLGADKYEVDARNGTVTRTADIGIDLSGIAKGYAVDKVAELLDAAGFGNYLVEIGGEVRVQGWRQPEQGWVIAIEAPQAAERLAYARVGNQGENFALAGSGDYRNYFEAGGKRYSHEIDPHTGRPVDHALASATVLAATTAEADAWATAMMVLGPVDGPLLAGKLEMAVYFINRKEGGWESGYTPGFGQYLVACNPADRAADCASAAGNGLPSQKGK